MSSLIKVPTSRLEALSDGIYAIAMTLIILGISAPVAGTIHSNAALNSYLIGILPEFILYFISFLLLASFWYLGHILFLMKKVDSKIIVLNLVLLMFVVVVPFSTDLIGSYWQFKTSVIVFGLNIFIIQLLYYWIILHAYKNKLLPNQIYTVISRIPKDDTEYEIKHKNYIKDVLTIMKKIKYKIIIPLTLPIISIALTFIHPVIGIAIYAIIPILNKVFIDITLSEDEYIKIKDKLKKSNH